MISINKSVQYFNDGLTELDRLADHDKEKKQAQRIRSEFQKPSKGIQTSLIYLISRSIVNPIRNTIEGLNEGAGQVASASGEVSAVSHFDEYVFQRRFIERQVRGVYPVPV